MSSKTTIEVPQWVSGRILSFFNQVQTVQDITDGPIKDNPSDGTGRTIGAKLAARILRERSKLPRRRFTEFAQLDDITGVGPGTIKDLVYSFGQPAAEAFVRSMYDNYTIFRENWPLEYFRTEFDDAKEFEDLVFNEEDFRLWVANKIIEISQNRNVPQEQCDQMVEKINQAYIDPYNNSIPAPGYALALWFYEFDADNWFSWEVIQERTIAYFDYHMDSYPWEMELRFFKGFQNLGIIPPGITPDDLPVVVNWAEQSITLWFSALYD